VAGPCNPAVVDYMLSVATPLPHHSKEEPVIPEREDMIALALELEKIAEAQGWDRAPILGIVIAFSCSPASAGCGSGW
jgi:hypothetical protein